MKDKICKETFENNQDKKSNSSVLDLSLGSTKDISKKSITTEFNSELKKELMDEVNLPIENEIESTRYLLVEEEKEIDLENGSHPENRIFFKKKLNMRKRSKSFEEKKNYKNKYSHIRKEPIEYVSPLKLCRKTYGNIQKWNKKSNEVLCDFQKNMIDCKSCNDEDSQDDLFLAYSETERVTPSQEDLLNLLNCRKKMFQFKNCINDRTTKEYENILNSDNIFADKYKLNHHNIKKNNFWHRHIRQILRENNNSCLSRLSAGCIVNNKEKDKEDGLFILGILESAVNETKGRNTTNI